MSRFSPVTLQWKGSSYTIPADRMMRAIALIEDHISLAELRAGAKPTRIAAAFAAVINYAGAKDVTDEDVYSALFTTDQAEAEAVVNSVQMLMVMMVPPEHLVRKGGGAPAQAGKPQALSRKRSRQPSRKNGARHASSGA